MQNSLKQIVQYFSLEDKSSQDHQAIVPFQNTFQKLMKITKDNNPYHRGNLYLRKTDPNIAKQYFQKDAKSQYLNSSITQKSKEMENDNVIESQTYDRAQHRLNRKTLQGLGIRRSHSFQQQSDSNKYSETIIDHQHELKISLKKNQLLRNQIQQLSDRQQQMRSELLELKNKEQTITSYIYSLQERLNEEILNKQKIILGYEQQINMLKHKESSYGEVDVMLRKEIQKGKIFLREKEGEVISQMQRHGREVQKMKLSYQSEMQKMRKDFRSAKMIGQVQINSLLETISQKDQEILALKSKVNQDMLTKKSTYTSENMSNNSKIDEKITEKRFLDRFITFSKLIDRRLYHSSSNGKERLFLQKTVKSIIEHEPQHEGNFNRHFSQYHIFHETSPSQSKSKKKIAYGR